MAGQHPRVGQQEIGEGTLLLESQGEQLTGFLTMEGGADRIPVDKTPFRLGRAPDSELVLDDTTVSRRHAQIELVSGVYCLQDLGSSNGVLVNGHSVSRTLLVSGDRIQMGNVRITFDLGDQEPTELKFPARRSHRRSRYAVISGMVAAGLILTVAAYRYTPVDPLREPVDPANSATVATTKQPFKTPASGALGSESPVAEMAVISGQSNSEPEASATENSADDKESEGAAKPADDEDGRDSKLQPVDTRRLKGQPRSRSVLRPDTSEKAPLADVSESNPALSDDPEAIMAAARAEYLAGRGEAAVDTLRKVPASGDAVVDRSLESLRRRIETLVTLHRRAVAAYEKGDHDSAFRQWSGFLAAEQKLFEDRRSTYANSVMAQVIGEYYRLGEQAETERRFHDAYRMWQRAAALEPAGASAAALRRLQVRARKLFREGYRLETAELAQARERWQQVLELVPPGDEYHIKARAKLAWYQRYGR